MHSRNEDLQRQINSLQFQLNAKERHTEAADRRAREAEQREAHLKELARRFWRDEWSGMKDYVGLFNNGDRKDIDEIEKRVRAEYGELFGSDTEGRERGER